MYHHFLLLLPPPFLFFNSSILFIHARPRTHTHTHTFTGVPNIVPPRGHVHMLERFSETHFKTSQIPCRIFTFGFGFDLDSKMLSEIATAGQGAYNYIPTAAMVGTVFVNAISV